MGADSSLPFPSSARPGSALLSSPEKALFPRTLSALSQICRTPLSTLGLTGWNSPLQEIPGLFSHRRQTGAEGNRKGDRLLYGNDPHRRRRTHLLRSVEGGAGKSRP